MRVDIGAEFYVRWMPLLDRARRPDAGRPHQRCGRERLLIEAKFVDGLRSVAATMPLDGLQEQRMDFVKAVQEAVGADLQSNGLEPRSVRSRGSTRPTSSTSTPTTFDAGPGGADPHHRGAQEGAQRDRARHRGRYRPEGPRSARAELTIERTKREAELSQQRDIANKTAATRAETAQKEQAAKRSEEEARIEADQAIAEREAAAKRARESANIEAQRAVQQKDTEAKRDLQIAQESAIAVANKSREESEAKTAAEQRALAIAAEEKVERMSVEIERSRSR